jgi:DNA-binding XRE family transcriptional regulator
MNLLPSEIKITNQKIISFYCKHKHIDIENINLFLCETFEKILNPSLETNIANEILETMKGLRKDIIQSSNIVSMKFLELRKEQIDDMKIILNNTSNTTTDKIIPILNNFATSIQDKTMMLIGELFPKNQESLKKSVSEILKEFQKNIVDEASNHQTINTLFLSLEQKYIQTQNTLQQLFLNTETNIQNKLQDLREVSQKNNLTENSLHQDVSRILQKMENSSSKGRISENILYSILENLYTTAEIKFVGTQKETGDFMLLRKGKSNILIENKNYSVNVNSDEVKKFIRDTETQNCCGLFLSQKTGIAFKENFEIDIQNGNVLLFVHEVNNDREKIKIAIDIIDSFKTKIDEINFSNENTENSISILPETVDEINREYKNFIGQRLSLIKNIKENAEKTIKQIEGISFPCLDKYLSQKFGSSCSSSSSSTYVQIACQYCGFNAKSKQSLSAHLRKCRSKECTTETISLNLPIN